MIIDELWEVTEYLRPHALAKPRGECPRIQNRDMLRGILFVLSTDLPLETLSPEMDCGAGMTCWPVLEGAGTQKKLRRALLDKIGEADRIDLSRASLDSSSVPTPRVAATGKNPTGRGKSDMKRHLVVERQGIPLAVMLSGTNVHGIRMVENTARAIGPIKRPVGCPHKRPQRLHADKAYDSREKRHQLRRRGISPRIARKGVESSERLGRHHRVVEQTHSWPNRYCWLRIRYGRLAEIHLVFLHIGCVLICWKFIQQEFVRHSNSLVS